MSETLFKFERLQKRLHILKCDIFFGLFHVFEGQMWARKLRYECVSDAYT